MNTSTTVDFGHSMEAAFELQVFGHVNICFLPGVICLPLLIWHWEEKSTPMLACAYLSLNFFLLGVLQWNEFAAALLVAVCLSMFGLVEVANTYGKTCMPSRNILDGDTKNDARKELAKTLPVTLRPMNVYQDPHQSWRMWFTFGGQAMLVGFYFHNIAKAQELDGWNYVFWLCAMPVQLALHSQFGSGFYGEQEMEWWKYISSLEEYPAYGFHSEEEHIIVEDPDLHLHAWCMNIPIRFCLSFFVNFLFEQFITITLPLLLMQNVHTLDFLLNAAAVAYATTLDDVEGKHDYKVTNGYSGEHHQDDEYAHPLNRPANLLTACWKKSQAVSWKPLTASTHHLMEGDQP